MILDARIENTPLDRRAQVVILGAGPAGMTLARELASVAQVLVIESGGFEDDPDQQALLVGECAGMDYPLTETRARQFGGSSSLWAGYCAVFDPHDFSLRDWVPGSGWPFGVESIEPYYARTSALLNLGELSFDAREIAKRAGFELRFDNETFVPTTWRFGTPTQRFGESLRGEFETSSNITTLIYANVVDIRVDASHGAVSELVVRTLNGREGRVTADLYVLACGGIETPRLLLSADTQIPDGVGNSSGMVGRCFMEHPHQSIYPFIVWNDDLLDSWTRRSTYDGGKEFLPCLGLSAQAQEEARILNARAHIYRTPEMRSDETPRVGLFMEQAPNRNSRILLADSRDGLGMRRARLDWQLTELDWRTFSITAGKLAAEFERAGVAKVLGGNDRLPPLHSNHHLGTTRMSQEKEDGVVNPDCRLHDFGNLYIIGGSIFPTVSWANPTFTLIALTLRLADTLRRLLQPDIS